MGNLRKVRLNLGAGNKHWPGWVNCDLHGDQDRIEDVTKLSLNNNCADEIAAIHVLEHIHRMKAPEVLKEWKRVLKPGGMLAIEVPCLDKILAMYSEGEKSIAKIQLGIFGDPRDAGPDMMHQWCWFSEELMAELWKAGFAKVELQEPFFHVAKRDMRVVAFK